MDTIRPYSGVAGDIIRQFIQFKTLISAIPMAIAWLVLSLAAYFLEGKMDTTYLAYALLIISSVLIALFVGRFAMAAEQGDYQGGFFCDKVDSADMASYAVRYLVFNLFWIIPCLILVKFLFEINNLVELYILLRLGISLSGSVDLWYALLVVLSFFGPLFAPLLASYTQSLSEIFSLKPWHWLLFKRARDLPAYLAQVVGGMVLFFMKYFLPLYILKLLIFKISLVGGLYFNRGVTTLPLIILPIILGRLSGAFIAVDEENYDDGAHEESPKDNKTVQQGYKIAYEKVLKNIETMPQSELEMAEQEALAAEPSVYKALVLSYIYKKNQPLEKALPQAQQALKQCIENALGYDAVRLFQYYAQERTAFKLPPEQLLELADYAVLHNAYNEAAWCYITAIVELPEEQKLSVQKKFLHMADTARQHGAVTAANSLLTLFCKQFPDSPLSEFARQQIND